MILDSFVLFNSFKQFSLHFLSYICFAFNQFSLHFSFYHLTSVQISFFLFLFAVFSLTFLTFSVTFLRSSWISCLLSEMNHLSSFSFVFAHRRQLRQSLRRFDCRCDHKRRTPWILMRLSNSEAIQMESKRRKEKRYQNARARETCTNRGFRSEKVCFDSPTWTWRRR